ncbi:LA_2272 family surface repeat-containing protein [Xylanibacter muris]|uniref:Uncharacterized protein n=1 Tax=Xylanibacter muris TaxID=2736290 RepID=A0ABX2AIL6_9BACT|nr:hypothetical protein [Xylanibacter muris]NPD90785.1 hypothetical protein [Xylanibacter muris]
MAQSVERHRYPNIGVGVNRFEPDSSLYSNSNFAVFGNVDTLRGVQLGLLTGFTNKEMRGVNIGGLTSFSYGKAYGVTLAGIMTSVNGDMRGVQLATVSNIANKANGIQVAGLTNAVTSPFRGVQISAISNISMGVKRGIQFSGASNICSSYMRGIQVAAYNYADTLNGSQVGFVNVCMSHPRGVQVGIINYSRDTLAHKIGLVNITPKTRIDLMFYGGSSTKTNLAVRFRNRSTYRILGVGTHYMGFDEKFSGALFYRVGQYIQLGGKWTLGGDIGYYHIETFLKNSDDRPDRLYSLQARINGGYWINNYFGAFMSVGYGDTRYYRHSRRYRSRPIIEAGVSFRLMRSNR